MQSEQIEFDTLEQQQAVFGAYDENIKIIEKDLGVTIVLRNSNVDIIGEEPGVTLASAVINSLMRAHDEGESIDAMYVLRMLELVRTDEVEDAFKASKDVVVLTHRAQPIRCKTIGQKNYVKALQENTVTICIGPAGTGKTFLAVAQAVAELKRGEIERIVMSRPAIEAGEERLGFLPSCIERMTFGTDFHMDVFACRTCYECVATVAGYCCLMIIWMYSFFHCFHLFFIYLCIALN